MVRPISVRPEHSAVEKRAINMLVDILPNDLIMGAGGKLKEPAHGAVTNKRVTIGQPLCAAYEMGVVGSPHVALA